MVKKKMSKNFCYFVIDMKSFFASVECVERGLDPMTTKLVVADSSRSENTVCLAVSPALRKLGVQNRCRLFQIPKDIDFIIAEPRMKKYIEYTAEIYSLYLNYFDKNDIHVYSIDECFIDVTDYLKIYNTKARELAQLLMQEIYEKTKIPCTIGIGTNLYLAKIALDITAKKTKDRIGFLDQKKYIRTLWNHKPITDFWQISTGISKRLEKFGITDMQGIANFNEDILYKEFGINAELLIDHAWGEESCTMKDIKTYKNKSKMITSSQILPCNYTFNEAKLILKEMIQNGCYELSKYHLISNSLSIFVEYGDTRGDVSKGRVKMSSTTNSYSIIVQYALNLFDKIVNSTKFIRKIGYSFASLSSEQNEQYDLFIDIDNIKKEKQIVSSINLIKDKYGKNSLLKGLDLTEKATQQERNNSIGGHKSGEGKNAKN